ncbi:isochorismatase [Kiloniella litopenaei]|uniref:Isochorismatase n=1 Tax=Kiloniella litopenaei TaxID=1549748 RepID=A0A0M2R432_9PROT|nr:cysteine hydrolase family protein [Kiloniella litopenaei]KKJ76426.1 isochorismatase [Kiloniella litopenaei]
MSTAVIVIDMQQGLVAPMPQPYQIAEVIKHINQVTEEARQKKIPVFFVHHESPESIVEYESSGWQLAEGLKQSKDDKIIRKTTPDSFLHTSLEAELKSLGATKLVITGYATEFCVDTTIRRAAGLGYDITLVADAHTTHDKEHASAEKIRAHHNATLPNITSFGSQITAVSLSELTL